MSTAPTVGANEATRSASASFSFKGARQFNTGVGCEDARNHAPSSLFVVVGPAVPSRVAALLLHTRHLPRPMPHRNMGEIATKQPAKFAPVALNITTDELSLHTALPSGADAAAMWRGSEPRRR